MNVTIGRMRDGLDGVRDVDAPCVAFRNGTPRGECESDGHYICQECEHLSKRKTPVGRAVELDELLESGAQLSKSELEAAR